MLPERFRNVLFDRLSVQTMRYVDAVPTDKAKGLTEQVYRMVQEEFFINGSITSHSVVPELMAGMWCGGREAVLVEDQIDRGTKEAMSAILSQINECPYCEDMLVSLVYAADENDMAGQLNKKPEIGESGHYDEPILEWTRKVANGQWDTPFPLETKAFPEAVGSLLAFNYINRFSHVVMDGSPIEQPLGLHGLRQSAIKFFGRELKFTLEKELEPGRSLQLLPASRSSADLKWTDSNPRLKEAFSRWFSVVEHHADQAIPPPVRETVKNRVDKWSGETMPISRSWVKDEVHELRSEHRDLARFAMLVALSPYQVDESVVKPVQPEEDKERFVRLLAWASLIGARAIATGIAESTSVGHSSG